MRVIVSGSSGLIGTALTERLAAAGHEVIRLVRRPATGAGEVSWDPTTRTLDPSALAGAGAVINLNGRSIGAARWSAAEKQRIVSSRLEPTATLAAAVASLDDPPAFVSASAIGYYGDRGDTVIAEGAAPGSDFLARLCVEWEAATEPAAAAGSRVVLLRTGIVLTGEGGALGKMLTPFKLGVGGRLGKGDQWWSWISLEDEVGAIEHLMTSGLSGPVNLVSPHPVTNAEFTEALGEVLRRPTLLPTPRLALNALLGKELAEALLFTSARVEPRRLLDDGYSFVHGDLTSALRSGLAA